MADWSVPFLGNHTLLQYAHTPYMDMLASMGCTGMLKTVADGFHPGSEVANMSVMGYDLPTVYEGRGVLEAASIGVDLDADDMAMRCNLVCVEGAILKNHSAGHITTEEADQLIAALEDCLGSDCIHFYTGVQYRHLLVVKGGDKRLACVPPHDIPLKPFRSNLVKALCPEAQETADLLRFPKTAEQLNASEMTCPSCFVPLTEEIKQYAAPSFNAGRPVLETAEEIMHRIYQDFTYDSSATSIATPINESLAMKRGVCQDFAHVGIACLRSFGLAARYVSGYIRTRRAAEAEQKGDIDMIGGDASHAWFSVYVPSFGWVDLDPTNNMYMQSEHLTVGWGRDFDDMSPIKGIMTGGGNHTISVDVSVRTTT